jgi:spore germination cell wall hydrolase CwlJ-like protein
MTFEPRTSDVRALTISIALGSCIGLAIGGAYIAGGFARNAITHSFAEASGAHTPGADAPDPAASLPAVDVSKPQTVSLPLAPTSLRDRFHLTLATSRSVDQPFPMSAALATEDGRARETKCLAQAVYYEARGESASGQAAVAQVVLNRVRHPAFPKTICGVVFQRVGADCQFSFVCDGAMRQGLEGQAWTRAMGVAKRALGGAVMADIGGATHFHAARITTTWASSFAKVAQIGEHIFYRFARHSSSQPLFHAQPETAPVVVATSVGRNTPASAGAPAPMQLADAGPAKSPLPTALPSAPPPATKAAEATSKPVQPEIIKTQDPAPTKTATAATTAS